MHDWSPYIANSSVDVASVVDVDDADPLELLVDGIHDSVAAAPGGAHSDKLAAQRTADS